MKTVSCILNRHTSNWGGDLKVLLSLQKGMQDLGNGYELKIYSVLTKDAMKSDFIFICGNNPEMGNTALVCKHYKIPFGWIPWFECPLEGMMKSFRMRTYLAWMTDRESSKRLRWLKQTPSLIELFMHHHKSYIENYNFIPMLDAQLVLHSSEVEKKSFERFFSGCNSKILYWTVSPREQEGADDSFLKLTGLKSKEYLLQVGRLEPRKNQALTILATENLDIPLVFIASKSWVSAYQELLLERIIPRRKAPIWIVGMPLVSQAPPNVRHIPLETLLERPVLNSAYAHASMHILPSFYELPGLVSFEALKFNTPSLIGHKEAAREYYQYQNPSKETPFIEADHTSILSLEKAIERHLNDRIRFEKVPIFDRQDHDVATDLIKILENVHA